MLHGNNWDFFHVEKVKFVHNLKVFYLYDWFLEYCDGWMKIYRKEQWIIQFIF